MPDPVLVMIDLIDPEGRIEAEPLLWFVDGDGCLHEILDDGSEIVRTREDTVALAAALRSSKGLEEAA